MHASMCGCVLLPGATEWASLTHVRMAILCANLHTESSISSALPSNHILLMHLRLCLCQRARMLPCCPCPSPSHPPFTPAAPSPHPPSSTAPMHTGWLTLATISHHSHACWPLPQHLFCTLACLSYMSGPHCAHNLRMPRCACSRIQGAQ